MASKKRKMEEDDDNTDQESKPTNSAKSEAGEDSGVEQAPQQLVAPTRSTTSIQVSSHQLSPRSASNPDPLHQLQPIRGPLKQPRLSPKPVIDRESTKKLLKDFDSLKLSGVSSSPPSLKLQPFDASVTESGSVTVSPDAGIRVGLKRSRSNLADNLPSIAPQDGENEGGSDDAEVPSDLLSPTGEVGSTNAEINLRQKRRKESEENMQNLIPSVDPLPSTGIVIHEGGESTSTKVLLSGAQDGENKGDSDDAKPPFVPLAQGTGSDPGSISANTTAGDESNRPVSIAAGEVLSATDTDIDMLMSTTEVLSLLSDEIQGDKEESDASQDGNTPGNSSAWE